jgi:NTP pyrophosphatase (non-canonical NTP hydrolase)
MTFDEYQELAKRTDLSSEIRDWNSPKNFEKLLGLCGEAGEISEKFKKILRDKGGIVSDEDREELIKELGDVLWYVAIIAEHLDVDFNEVAKQNIAKLASRAKRNLIHGAGDNR